MQVRAIGNALAIALISIILIIGALSISLVEFVPEATPTSTSVAPLSTLPVATASSQPTVTAETMVVLDTPTETITSTPTITATAPSSCPIPPGWGQVVVQSYDTLGSIAARYRIDAVQLRNSNCLVNDALVAGTVLYVPPVATNTAVICNQGMAGWAKNYTVRSGDNLYSIATSYGTSAAKLKSVNCRTSDLIYAGELLWVPILSATLTPLPTYTPNPADTAIPYPTEPLTETALPYTLTPVPSPVPNTPIPLPTVTASPTAFQ